jgi:multicomponent Na+:H+ antiporter subunit B
MSDADAEERRRKMYIESPIIMSTVRVIAPFVLTFGLFIMFHGADSAGGGFQGGVIVATVVLMFGVAFGIDPTREWVNPAAVVATVCIGLFVFLGVGFGTVALGGGFLDYSVVPIPKSFKYSIELVEIAIGVIVAGVISGLFFAIDAATDEEGGEGA